MDEIIEQLLQVCSREIDAFNQLLQTLHQKQRAIVEGEIERLKQHVSQENEIIARTRELEADRLAVTRELARRLSLENLNPRLSEIVEQVEEKYAQRLREQRNLLRSIVEKIQTLNQSNQFLLSYSLQFIDNSLKMLLQSEGPVYEENGKVRDEPSAKIVDHRV